MKEKSTKTAKNWFRLWFLVGSYLSLLFLGGSGYLPNLSSKPEDTEIAELMEVTGDWKVMMQFQKSYSDSACRLYVVPSGLINQLTRPAKLIGKTSNCYDATVFVAKDGTAVYASMFDAYFDFSTQKTFHTYILNKRTSGTIVGTWSVRRPLGDWEWLWFYKSADKTGQIIGNTENP